MLGDLIKKKLKKNEIHQSLAPPTPCVRVFLFLRSEAYVILINELVKWGEFITLIKTFPIRLCGEGESVISFLSYTNLSGNR